MAKKNSKNTLNDTVKAAATSAVTSDDGTTTTKSVTQSNSWFDTEEEKKEFIARLTAFILVGFVAPIIYLIVRYNLFRPTTGIQIGLWGVIVVGIMIALVGILVWYYMEAMKFKYTIVKQIISGVVRFELPMLVAILLLTYFKDNLDLVVESLWVIFGTTMLAIPINPLPEFCFKHNIDGAGSIAKTIYKRIHEEDSTKTTTENNKESE